MNGDWIFVVFFMVSFVLIIIASSMYHTSASLVGKYEGDDAKLIKATECLLINTGLGLGIGISGLIFVIIAMLLLVLAPLALAILGLFPAKMIFKVLYGVIILGLGVAVIIISSMSMNNIRNSETYINADDGSTVKHELDLAITLIVASFGVFIGLVVFLFLLFVFMAIYDYKKSKERTENLVNEAMESLLKFSEKTFNKVKSHYDVKEKMAVDDTLDVNPVETMIDSGIQSIEDMVQKKKLQRK